MFRDPEVKKLNVPNKLTVLRILLTPILVFFLISSLENKFLFALLIFSVASITDQIDGFIARKNNQVTNFGKIADPLADKILVVSVLLCLIQLGVITALPVVIIIVREFLVVYIRLIAASQGTIIAANNFGKLKTVSQILVIIFMLVVMQINAVNLIPYCELAIWISAFFSTLSGVVYVKDNMHVIKKELT